MALIITAGASNANSYADTAFADAYFTATGRATEWAAITEQEGKLLRVMPSLESLRYLGSRATVEQALQFPRIAPFIQQAGESSTTFDDGDWTDNRGRVWGDDEIPAPIAQAQCEMAFSVGTNAEWLDPTYKKKMVKTGSVTLELRTSADNGLICDAAALLLAPFLTGGNGVGRTIRN